MAKKELDSICKACGLCNGTRCFALQDNIKQTSVLPKKIPETYSYGVRFTGDSMDCALPISIDSHTGCSYSCLYCFANNLSRAPDRNARMLKKNIKQGSFYSEFPIKRLEAFLDRSTKDRVWKEMYPLLDSGMPVQLGALGDPFDDLELLSGWSLKAIPLFIKYNIPVRVGTKGAIALQQPKYRKLFEKAPHLFWFAFSIISNSDDLISKVDINAPVTSERLKAMKMLTDMGCNASIRFRPFLPGISDAYEGEPEAWRVLMERAAEVGARAVSFEYIFLNYPPTPRQEAMYNLMYRAIGNPNFGNEWNAMSDSRESCRRGTRQYKYKMTMDIRDTAHRLGMSFGCSDPHFKEFNDHGCCCGIPEDDPVFGKWSRRQLTNVIVEARRAYERGEKMQISYSDWGPEWAEKAKASWLMSFRDWHRHRVFHNHTWGDAMRNKWNMPMHPRSPFVYFEGVLRPVGIDSLTQDVVYEYRDWDENFERDQLELVEGR